MELLAQRYKRILFVVVVTALNLAALLSGTLSSAPAAAATGVNPQINFQARLQNNVGASVPDGNYNIEFKIYQDGTGCVSSGSSPCGGTLKWTEDWLNNNSQGVQVKNGYFSVLLGSVNAFNSSVDFNQDTLWLSINIGNTSSAATFATAGGDGEMLPFKRFASNPYALNSGALGGLTSSQYVQIAQGVQVDSSTGNASIAVNKTGGTANILQLQRGGIDVALIDNAGTVLFRPQTDSTTALQVKDRTIGNVVFDVDTANDRVGINKNNPATALDVSGTVTATAFSGNGSSLTSLNGSNISSGTVADARLSSQVTLQANIFNGASQLVQLNGSTQLPAVSGALVTNLNASNLASGTVNDARLSSNVPLINAANSFTNANTFNRNGSGTGDFTLAVTGTPINDATSSLIRVGNAISSGNSASNGGTYIGLNAPGSGAGSAADLINLQTNGTSRFKVDSSGTATATAFSGNGSSLTSLNGSNISSGTVADARLSSLVTLQANTFNGAGQLVQLNGSTQLPAVSGALLTNLNATSLASGTVNDARLSSQVTLQANTFNGASQLVQLNASTELPAVSGVNLTNLNATNIASGTLDDARLSANVPLLNVNDTFSGIITLSRSLVGASDYTLGLSGRPINVGSSSLLSIGNQISSGNNATNGGTYIGLNTPSSGAGSAADLINLQTNGTSRFKVDSTGVITGNGSGLTTLNAGNISSGTLSDSRLSSNVPLLNAANSFTTTNTFQSATDVASAVIKQSGAASAGDIFNVQSSGSVNFIRVVSASATTGSVTIQSVGSANNVTVQSGATTTSSANSGSLNLASGATSGTTSNSGAVNISSGNVTNGNSGNIVIGSGSASGTRGNVLLQGSGGLVGIGLSGTPSALLSVGGTTGSFTVDTSGNVTATSFTGVGSGLTSLNGSNISSGTVADARLSSLVTLQSNTFNGAGQLVQLNGSTQLPAVSGINLTNLNASNLASGTVNDARLSSNVAFLGNNQNFTGLNQFSHDGSGGGAGDYAVAITGGTAANAAASLIQIGAAIASGNNVTNGGTYIGLNAPSSGAGSAADFLNFQVNGSSKVKIDNTGIITGIGSGLTSLNGSNISSGTVADARLSSLVTLQANTFNGANQLVQLNGSTQLPAVSGVNLTNLNASSLASGTVNDARLSSNVALLNATQTFTSVNTFNRNGSGTGDFSLAVTGTPVNDATSSLIRVGGAIVGGNSSTNGGTYLGINSPAGGTGSSADFVNFQANGVARFSVTNAGTATATTSFVAPLLDSTGALSVGTSSATSVTVGKTGTTLALQGNNSTTLAANNGGFSITLAFASTGTSNKTITLPNESGTVCTTGTICSGYQASGSYATTTLNNLGTTSINASLLTGTTNIDLGSGANPFRDLYLGGNATNNFRFTGSASAARTLTLPDISGTLALVQSGTPGTAQSGNINVSGTIIGSTAVQTALLDTPSGTTTLNIGTNNATAGVALNQSTTVATGKNFTVTAGATALSGATGGSSTALTVSANAASNVGASIQGAASSTAAVAVIKSGATPGVGADQLQLTTSDSSIIQRFDSAGDHEQLGYFTNGAASAGVYGNLLTFSEQFDNAAWTKTNVTPTANDGSSNPAPDNQTTADKLVSSATSATVVQTYTTSTNGTYTFSVWLKTNSGTQPVQLRIDSTGATPTSGTANSFTATTTWQRFSVTQTFTGTPSNIKPTIVITNNTATVVAWGAQMVAAATPLAYVRTVSTNVAQNDGVVSNGAMLIQPSANSTSVFAVQNAAQTSVFAVDTTNTKVRIGTGTPTLGAGTTGALYVSDSLEVAGQIQVGGTTNNSTFDATTKELTFNGTARHAKKITLTAEYAGAVLDAPASNNSGTMTAGYDSTNRYGYYKWTTGQATAQGYDVVIQIPVPSDWSAWASSTPLNIVTYTSNTSTGPITATLTDTGGTVETGINGAAITPTSNTTWQTKSAGTVAGTYTANSVMILRLHLTSPTSGDVRVATITMDYLSKY